MINAGKLNQRIAFYLNRQGKSARGAPTVTIEQQFTTYAELIEAKANAVTENDTQTTIIDYQYRIRWRENIEPGFWCKVGSRYLKITAVNDSDPLKEQIILDAQFNSGAEVPGLYSEGKHV